MILHKKNEQGYELSDDALATVVGGSGSGCGDNGCGDNSWGDNGCGDNWHRRHHNRCGDDRGLLGGLLDGLLDGLL